jgi:hypothetical protein
VEIRTAGHRQTVLPRDLQIAGGRRLVMRAVIRLDGGESGGHELRDDLVLLRVSRVRERRDSSSAVDQLDDFNR